MGNRTIVLTLFALCFGFVPPASRPSMGQASLDNVLDADGDGVLDSLDVCPTSSFGVAVDVEGRPLGDIDKNCTTDLHDFGLMQLGWTGNAEFDAVGVWDAFIGANGEYYGRFTFYASHLLVIDALPPIPDANLFYDVEGNTVTASACVQIILGGACTDTLFFDSPDSMNSGLQHVLYLYRR